MKEGENSDLFRLPSYGDTIIHGVKGSRIHAHESPFGCGVFTDQTASNGSGRHITTYNRFNNEVDSHLSNIPVFKPFLK